MSAQEKHEYISQLLKQYGIVEHLKVFDASTKTSQDAANQIGCSLGQIGKSMIIQAGDKPVLVITSGVNRVSLEKLFLILQNHSNVGPKRSSGGWWAGCSLKNLRMGDIKKADADFVYEKTGFPIGGVAPFGHKIPIEHIFIDRDLIQFETIWCAGGTPHAVFEITPQKLIEITHAKIADIKE